ncbi:7075_t:CDS:1, partial [Dentiscutata heterogama]
FEESEEKDNDLGDKGHERSSSYHGSSQYVVFYVREIELGL